MAHETAAYAQYLPKLLPAAGFALQWLRQHSGFKDRFVVLIALALAGGCYFLCLDYEQEMTFQHVALDFFAWLPNGLPSVLGGTWIASVAAKNGMSVIPITNSR